MPKDIMYFLLLLRLTDWARLMQPFYQLDWTGPFEDCFCPAFSHIFSLRTAPPIKRDISCGPITAEA
jgi:hypothetical protein